MCICLKIEPVALSRLACAISNSLSAGQGESTASLFSRHESSTGPMQAGLWNKVPKTPGLT